MLIRMHPAPLVWAGMPFQKKTSTVGLNLPPPQFEGESKSLANRRWVSPETFQKLLKVSATPYVGRLPGPLLQAGTARPKQVFKALDELAALLRPLRFLQASEGAFTIGDSKVPVSLDYVGMGGYGAVWKVTVGEKSFALKVYHRLEEVFSHGAYGEIATGLYLSRKNIKDLVKFHCGNPPQGWGLFEFISPTDTLRNRSGVSLSTLPVHLKDDCAENRINDIVIDYGGIEKPSLPLAEYADFAREIASKDIRRQRFALANMGVLNEALRQEVFLLAMATGVPSVQAKAVEKLLELPESFVSEAFQQAMATGVTEVQASAALSLFALDSSSSINGFKQLMATGNSRVQASAASKIDVLPSSFRREAFEMAMATGISEVQAAAAGTRALPDDFKEVAYRIVIATGNPLSHANAVGLIQCLPFKKDPEVNRSNDNFKIEIYATAMATGQPLIQASAAKQIFCLPERYQTKALALAMATDDPTVVTAAASGVKGSAKPLKTEFLRLYLQFMQKTNPLRAISRLQMDYPPKGVAFS